MAMVLDAFAGVILEKLVNFAQDRISSILNVRGDLRVLEDELKLLRSVLADAETRKIRDEPIRVWVTEVRELLYDADDLLDDCQVEGEGRLSTSPPPQCCTPSIFHEFCFRNELAKRIRAITGELGKLHARTTTLHLTAGQVSNPSFTSVYRPLPLLPEENIVGIEEDCQELVNHVITGGGGRSQCPILAITGMPGIGKTTLAHKVSNDLQVKNYFNVIIPLCVSREYKEVDLLNTIGRSVMKASGMEDNMNEDNYYVAVKAVRELLKGTRLLLVLDDIWEARVWECLNSSLSSVANGSRVLVTTRNECVAQEINAFHTHRARELTEKEGWLMLRRQVFGDDERDEEVKMLEVTGIEIVRKCQRLPLAIKSIAGMLKRRGRTVREWEAVRDSETWSLENLDRDIKPSLLVSYEDLPPHLKQCFVYCSSFPEDYRFHHQTLVQMWIAAGLVLKDGNRALEDIGGDYYRELVMRNLLQAAPGYYDAKGCTMHDLMRTIGNYVARSGGVTTKDRHLFFVNKEATSAPDVTNKKCLRMILLSKSSRIEAIPDEYCRLKYLRVLDLTHTGVRNLPDSLGLLIQLRFLSVAFTKISRLPESIGKLRNLETLKANDMKNLRGLPSEITQLHKLSFLAVGSAGRPLGNMPVGIGKLQSLRTLRGFVVNDVGEENMKELGDLPDITHLSMYKVDKVRGREEAEKARLFEKVKLNFLRLSLSRGSLSDNDHEKANIETVFQGLNPTTKLEALHIDGFYGRCLPNWIMECSLVNLDYLKLDDCKNINRLPPLGRLPNLSALQISGAISVTEIGQEFFSASNSQEVSFPRLQELYLKGMTNLKRIIGKVGPGTLPNLKRLQLIKCPRLRSLPEGMENARKLTRLSLEDDESIVSIMNLASVSELKLTRNSKLKTISGLDALEILAIDNCHELVQLECSNKLVYLSVSDDQMRAIPEWLKRITLVRRLNMKGTRELLTRCMQNGADWDIVKELSHVDVKTLNGTSYVSYRKDADFYQIFLAGDASADIPSSSNAGRVLDNEHSTFGSFEYHEEP